MIQGLAYFPGIQQIVGCSVVCSHGISPASIVLTIAPQLDFEAEGGTLTIFDGNSSLAFPDCKVDRHSLERNAAGLIWRLTSQQQVELPLAPPRLTRPQHSYERQLLAGEPQLRVRRRHFYV